MKVKLENAKILGVEKRKSAKGNNYLSINVMEENGDKTSLLDWDVENENIYQHGIIADFLLNIKKIGSGLQISVLRIVQK